MSRRAWFIWATFVVVVVGGLLLVPTSAQASTPNIPPWEQSPKVYPVNTDTTGWSTQPRLTTTNGLGTVVRLAYGEPYWNGTSVSVSISGVIESPDAQPPDGQTSGYRVFVDLICSSNASGRWSIGGTNAAVYARSGSGYGQADTLVDGVQTSASANCGSTGTPVGVQVRQEVTTDGVNYSCGNMSVCVMAWFPEDAHKFEGPDIFWCRATFGPDFTEESTAVVNGLTVTAAEMGCGEDYISDPDRYTDFDVVCAGAPRAEWLSYSWLGPWVGHYARCLFVPQGGWDADGYITEAFDQSPLGDVRDMLEPLGSLSVEGQCGPIAGGAVLGESVSLNTCDWPSDPQLRTWIALGVTFSAGFVVVLMILKALGIYVAPESDGGKS